jgi:hypothetical protein
MASRRLGEHKRLAEKPLAWELLALIGVGLNFAVVTIGGLYAGLDLPASGEVKASAHQYTTVWGASPGYKLSAVVAIVTSGLAALLVWHSYLNAETVVTDDNRCTPYATQMKPLFGLSSCGSPYRSAQIVRLLLTISLITLPVTWLLVSAIPIFGLPSPPCLRGKVIVRRDLLLVALVGAVTLLLASHPIECEAVRSDRQLFTVGGGRPRPDGFKVVGTPDQSAPLGPTAA